MELGVRLPQVNRRRRSASITTRVLKSVWLYSAVAAIGLVLHLWLALPLYAWYDRLLAWVPLVIFLVLLRQYVRETHKSIPLLVLVALQIYIFFSLPQFSQEDLSLTMGETYSPTNSAITMAMVLTVAGELLFILGYSVAAFFAAKGPKVFQKISEAPTPNWIRMAKLYSLVAFVVYTAATITVGYLPLSVRHLMTQLFNVHLGLALLLYIGHTFKNRRLLAFAYVFALGMSFIGLLQGMLGAIVGPFVLLFLTRWVWGKVFDFRWAVFAVLAVLILNPVKNEFRALPSWLNPEINSTELVQDRLNDWWNSFERVWVEGEAEDHVYTSTASRTNDLLSLTQAIDLVPEVIPYNAGEGMDDAMVFWIPRVLWPGKGGSTDLIYNRYALSFGYLSPEQVGKTSVALSVFTEGYWNFGIYGVIIFLFSSGLLFGAVFGNNGKNEQISTIVCIVYVAPTTLVLQALSVTLSSLPSFLIGITIALSGLSLATKFLNTNPKSRKQLTRRQLRDATS